MAYSVHGSSTAGTEVESVVWAMGCSQGASPPKAEDRSTVVRWSLSSGESCDEPAVLPVEPTLSFHSMSNGADRAKQSPVRSTHAQHVAKLEKFLKKVDAKQLEKAVHWKRCDHLVRML
eukprot:Skav229103  [mRNA]  locus=scaffold92:479184:479807:- [translate_table: standard]